jgi:hypothetical protein
MSHSAWIEYVRLVSFFASVTGLYILYNDRTLQKEMTPANWSLMAMSFAYWIVNCVATAGQRCICPEWTTMMLSLKLTALFSLLLTFSCALSLPLSRMASRQPVE